jgi:tetratricopeptide (TPR) repeat protein
MRAAAPVLLTRDQLRWLAPLRADRDNILAALHYWCETGDAENALGLAVALSINALMLGNETAMAEWVGEALAVPGEAEGGLRAIAEALHVVTSVMDPAAEGAVAYPGLIERLDAMDIETYPIAGMVRPVYAVFTKQDERVRGYLDQARAAQNEWLSATAWLMAAGLAENRGNFDEMRVSAAEALDRFRALGERWGLSMALRTTGTIRVFDGDLNGADAVFTEASQLLAELGHVEDLSQVQLRLAEIAARRGDLAKARQLSAAARSAVEAEGSFMDRGIAAAWWAAFEARWGDIDAARPYQAAAEQHLARFGPAHPVHEHLAAMVAGTGARIAIADHDLRTAREQAVRSYRAAVGAQDMSLLAEAAGTAAELALALGQPEQAAELLGAGAVVRGADDPTDPSAVQLVPLLRAGLGDERYEACYASGRALARPDAIERLDPAGLD